MEVDIPKTIMVDASPITKRAPRKQTARRRSYERYMASPEWVAKRDLVLVRDGRCCRSCQTTTALHVHHATYAHFGDERLDELVTVCENCHAAIHRLAGVGRRGPALEKATWSFIRAADDMRGRQTLTRHQLQKIRKVGKRVA